MRPAGFTALTEKYTLSGRGGTDKLTETLNSYIGALVECILRRDGDVLQFAGQLAKYDYRCVKQSRCYVLLDRRFGIIFSITQPCTYASAWMTFTATYIVITVNLLTIKINSKLVRTSKISVYFLQMILGSACINQRGCRQTAA